MLGLGAGGGCFDYQLPLFLSFHIDCHKGPLKAKQLQKH